MNGLFAGHFGETIPNIISGAAVDKSAPAPYAP